jgi:hypothetical protein
MVLIGATFASGCEDDVLVSADPHQRYQDGATTVLNGDPSMPIATAVLDEGCLQVSDSTCVEVVRSGRYCSNDTGPVDAVLVGGEVAEVICYENTNAEPNVVIDGDGDGDLDLPQQENGAVIVFDPSTDGKPFEGNIALDANNVTLYGNGPDKSIIRGNLILTGNNARVRGVRIIGNVTINLNTAALVLSVVEGNLEIESNNTLVAATDVFGNVKVTGNNTTLVNVRAGADWRIEGSGSVCDSNHAFKDENGDKLVSKDEIGGALSCP